MNKNKKIGAFAGKFLPPHIGHTNQIIESSKMCDVLYVVVCDNEVNSKKLCDFANIPYIPAKLRVKWLKQHFSRYPNIKILYMSEKNLLSFPNGMENWSKRFKKITKHKVNIKFADETYRELNEKYFPECEFVCFDRTVIDISASKIRLYPEKYFNYIIPEAQSFFKKIIEGRK